VNVKFSIWFTPEGQDIVERQGLEGGIFEDVQAIIPQHKLIAMDLPKDDECHEDQESRHSVG
jgi:hypothetical protein